MSAKIAVIGSSFLDFKGYTQGELDLKKNNLETLRYPMVELEKTLLIIWGVSNCLPVLSQLLITIPMALTLKLNLKKPVWTQIISSNKFRRHGKMDVLY